MKLERCRIHRAQTGFQPEGNDHLALSWKRSPAFQFVLTLVPMSKRMSGHKEMSVKRLPGTCVMLLRLKPVCTR
jgi:hypothetical protein